MLDRRDVEQINHGWGESSQQTPSPAAESAGRAFRFLQELARDLSQESISFPTFMDATVKIRDALRDPDADVGRVAQVVSGEPLLAARLVHLANSVAFNPGGRKVADVRSAVTRVGFNTVRTTAAAIALEQVRASKELAPFAAEAERVWRHSLDAAAIAYVLARALTTLFVAHMNFLRPHRSLGGKPPIRLPELEGIKTLQGRWLKLLQPAA